MLRGFRQTAFSNNRGNKLDKKVGVGVIGCGAIATVHAENFYRLPESELVATADVIEERTKALAKRFEAKAWYTDYRDLLKRNDITAVSICLPPYLHGEVGIACAEAGKHILVEKPIAHNLIDTDKLIKAARKAGVKLSVLHEYRFNEAVQWVHEAIERGEIGKLILGDLWAKGYRTDEYYGDGWRGKWSTAGGGVIISQTIHWLDLFQWFFGPVDEVYGNIDTLTHKIEVEDVAGAVIRFKNKAIGTCVASTSVKPSFPIRIDAHGSKGTLVLEGQPEGLRAKLLTEKEQVKKECIPKPLPIVTAPPFVPPEGHRLPIIDFLTGIIEDREPAVIGEEGRKSLEIAMAIYKSAKSDKAIKFPFVE